MLARAIRYLVENEDSTVVSWLTHGDPPLSTIEVAVHEDAQNQEVLYHIYETEEGRGTIVLNDREIVQSLISFPDQVVAMTLVWKLCRLFDENYYLDTVLRNLVERDTGLKLERTPFVLEGIEAVNKMDKSAYDENHKKVEYATITVDNDTMVLRLSLIGTSIKKLLIQHLRRVVWQTN